jgi:hypothetical protein
VTLAERLDNGVLHRKFDPVERNEPDNIPDPDNTDPTSRDTTELCETPVTKGSNDLIGADVDGLRDGYWE